MSGRRERACPTTTSCTRVNGAFCKGEKVYLREVETKDAGLLTEWKSEPYLKKMALTPDAVIDLSKQAEDVRQARDSEEELYLMVVVRDSEKPAGYVRINWMDRTHRFAWLRFAMGAERGKGYCKDALRALLAELFGQGVHRVEAEVYDFNLPSIGLLESLGFKREGVKRQAHFDGESYTDVVVFGLLAGDFKR